MVLRESSKLATLGVLILLRRARGNLESRHAVEELYLRERLAKTLPNSGLGSNRIGQRENGNSSQKVLTVLGVVARSVRAISNDQQSLRDLSLCR